MVKRLVVGARYGLMDWLAQRVTGALLAVFAVVVVITIVSARPFTYDSWRGLFSQPAVRIAGVGFAMALAWHAWVGMRDVLMDYIKPTALRLLLQVLVILTLLSYIGWAIQILWR